MAPNTTASVTNTPAANGTQPFEAGRPSSLTVSCKPSISRVPPPLRFPKVPCEIAEREGQRRFRIFFDGYAECAGVKSFGRFAFVSFKLFQRKLRAKRSLCGREIGLDVAGIAAAGRTRRSEFPEPALAAATVWSGSAAAAESEWERQFSPAQELTRKKSMLAAGCTFSCVPIEMNEGSGLFAGAFAAGRGAVNDGSLRWQCDNRWRRDRHFQHRRYGLAVPQLVLGFC